jgi:hypothetical protein
LLAKEEASRPVSLEKIQEVVARHYHIDIQDMKSRRRTDAIAFPRRSRCTSPASLTELSTTHIGDAFGGKDHTTVMHCQQQNPVTPRIGSLLFRSDQQDHPGNPPGGKEWITRTHWCITSAQSNTGDNLWLLSGHILVEPSFKTEHL